MGPLDKIKVLELGQVLAAPFCDVLLADFGADVIKVEIPGVGDNLRKMGPIVDGRSLWFAVENRNKKCITLNLKSEKGKDLLCELIKKVDVITENFKPGTLEKLGFDWKKIHKINEKAILVRISGYGQTGPYSSRYGYDRIGLAMGGLTYISGFPDKPPVRPGNSLADYLTGFTAALAIMISIYHRDMNGAGVGQEIDVGLYEPVFRILEFTALNYYLTGTVRERVGNTFPATVPSGHFRTKDGKWVSLAVGNDRIFERFVRCIGREDLLERPEYKTHIDRMQNRTELDQITADWINEHTAEECFNTFGEYVPIGPIHSIADIFEDPQYKARGNIIEVADKLWNKVRIQGAVPKMSLTPGEVKWLGPELGEHNLEIYSSLLGLTVDDIEILQKEGVI